MAAPTNMVRRVRALLSVIRMMLGQTGMRDTTCAALPFRCGSKSRFQAGAGVAVDLAAQSHFDDSRRFPRHDLQPPKMSALGSTAGTLSTHRNRRQASVAGTMRHISVDWLCDN